MNDRLNNPTASIATLGCKTNQFESAAMEERLRAAGFTVRPFEEGADLVIVNTCTVTAATDAQSRNLIRRARRLRPDCRVVVTGCYAQVDPESLARIPGVSLVLGNDEKEDLLRLLSREDGGAICVSERPSAPSTGTSVHSSYGERSRAFLQIQNGCDAFCAYCIIPYARGRSRSVLADQVLEQVRRLFAAGYPEVVLTGIHIGGYGSDLEPKTSLLELVRRIEGETPVRRLRLGSIEPTEITPALIDAVTSSEILCPHFHIPLQAGDDPILKLMNRHYTTAFFRQLVFDIRSRLPEAAIGLDVIVGFPGESEESFQRTLSFIESLPVTHLHVFPFSRRSGTPAATMAGQVPGDVAKQRASMLRDLGEEKNRNFAETFIGRTLELVVEGTKSGGLYKGLSRNYLPVFFRAPAGLEGERVRVLVTGGTSAGLQGIEAEGHPPPASGKP